MATETEKLFGDLSPEEVRAMEKQALIGGAARGLDLLKRMPALFKQRRWPKAEAAIDIATLAVCCVKIGARGQKIRVPVSLAMLGEKWKVLSNPKRAKPPSAHEIVYELDLSSLLDPV